MTLHEPLSKALLGEIEQQVDGECRAVLEAGEREAEAIIAAAHATARRRMHDAILAMRREASRRLRQANAQRSTRERMNEEARLAEVLRRACPQLIEAVVRRWQQSKSRRLWIEAVARSASERLIQGEWIVEHPAAWSDDDRRTFLSAVGNAKAGTVRFEESAEFVAGLRVRSPGALLDATPEAFLGNRPIVEAMLLAELGRAASEDAAPGGQA